MRLPHVAWAAAAVLTLLAGAAVALRAEDPASSPVLGAEDPYTHLVFTREHVEHGRFLDVSERLGIALYPPGMHALLGIVWVLSGLDLLALGRWAPLAFGPLAAAGTFALLRRHGPPGPWPALGAAAFGAWVVAVNPEHVVRSDLLFPTGLDLALLPWIFLGLADALSGDRRGLLTAAVPAFALVLAHPWIGFVVAGTGVLAAGFALLVRAERETRGADAALVALVLAGLALFSVAYELRYDSDKGFATAGAACVVAAFAAAGAFGLAGRGGLARLRGGRAPRTVAGLLLVAAVLGAWGFTVPRHEALPLHVDYVRMVAWPLLVAATAGAFAVAWRPSLAGLLGAALVAVSWPFTVIDVFGSWYLPHRTMVYLVAGAAVLAGCAAGATLRVVAAGASRFAPRRAAVATAVAALVLLPAAAGGVVALSPEPYVWDRYYEDDEYRVLGGLAARLDAADGREFVFVGSWVPNLFLATLSDEDHVGYRDGVWSDPDARRAEVARARSDGASTVYLLVDEHLRDRAERKGWDLGFAEGLELVDRAGDVAVYKAVG